MDGLKKLQSWFQLEPRAAGREVRGASLGETTFKDIRCRRRRRWQYPSHTGGPALTREPDANGPSKQLPEFFDRKPGVFDDFSHGESVDRVVAGDYHNACAVAHDRVLAFPEDLEVCAPFHGSLAGPNHVRLFQAGSAWARALKQLEKPVNQMY